MMKQNQKKCIKKIESRTGQLAEKPSQLLLANKDVLRWYENSRRSSMLNAQVNLRRLNLFCSRNNTTPKHLVCVGKRNTTNIENILLDHVSWMETQSYAPGYISGVVKAIKSWLDFNHIEIKRKIKITDADVAVRIQDEQIPTQEQLERIFKASTPRTRAIISMMAFAGIRPQVLGTADRKNGLRLHDLLDLAVNGRNIKFSKIPAQVLVKQQLSKSRNKYFTFLSEQGCKYILSYLRYRIKHGEILTLDSPLITRNNICVKVLHDKSQNQFLTTSTISDSIRKTLWGVVKIRPYTLRAYFDSQMLLAESHGYMIHAYRQFFMGHKGDIEARYTTNKGRLSEQMIKDMRRSFEQSQVFLSTKSFNNKKHTRLNVRNQQRQLDGLNQGVRFRDNTKHDDNLDSHEMLFATKSSTPFKVRIIYDDDLLLKYLSEGWDLIKELADGKYIIRRVNDFWVTAGNASAKYEDGN